MDSSGVIKYRPQKINYFSNALSVHLVDFPIYHIECISERHFIVAGGGGAAKTGVHNRINILELVPTKDSCAADLIMNYRTPEEIPDAIMSGSLMNDMPIISTRFVTGGSLLTIYHITFDADQNTFKITDYEILRDKLARSEFKCVKYMPGKILAGGLDGKLYIWNVESVKKVDGEIRAHSKEIDEIDVNLESQHVVTLSRDENRCAVWDLSSKKLLHQFKKDFINNADTADVKFIFRSCKFAYDTTNSGDKSSNGQFLLMACNSNNKKTASKLIRLNTKNYKEFKSIPITQDGIVALKVSLEGKFAALGTRSGSVMIYEVKNLNQIYKLNNAHHNTITGLEFLSPKPESLTLTNSTTCALLSVAIDRRVVLHRLKRRRLTSSICSILVMMFIIYLIFFYFYHSYS